MIVNLPTPRRAIWEAYKKRKARERQGQDWKFRWWLEDLSARYELDMGRKP